MGKNKLWILLSGLLMVPSLTSSFSTPHIPAGYKINQPTNPQTHLHSQHYCSHFSTLTGNNAVYILVFLVWVSFSTFSLPFQVFLDKLIKAKAATAISITTQWSQKENSYQGLSRFFWGCQRKLTGL